MSKAEGSLISRVLGSVFFKKSLNQASRVSKNSALMAYLAQSLLKKIKTNGLRAGLMEAEEQVHLLARFLKAYTSGVYKNVERGSLVTLVGVIIYFISPIDLIPDFLPLVGITDDIALLMWLFSTFHKEIERFRVWEKSNSIRID